MNKKQNSGLKSLKEHEDQRKIPHKLTIDSQTYVNENLKRNSAQEKAWFNYYEYGEKSPDCTVFPEQIEAVPDRIENIIISEKSKLTLFKEGWLALPDSGSRLYLKDDKLLLSVYDKNTMQFNDRFVSNTEIDFFTQNKIDMNKDNHDYLQKQVFYLGFGEELKDLLTKQMKKGKEEFSLQFKSENESRNAVYKLNFSKSQSSDMYFFNSFNLTLKNKGQELAHSFQVNGTKGVTAKEAINLLEGRAVKAVINFKEKGEQEVFIQIDKEKLPEKVTSETKLPFKYFNEKYGIDTEQILQNAPMKLTNENYRDGAIKSLEKGNFVKASFYYKNDKVDGLVTLTPQYKNLSFYDSEGKSLNSKYISADIVIENNQAKDFKQIIDPDANGLHNKNGNDFTDQLIDDLENGVGKISGKDEQEKASNSLKR